MQAGSTSLATAAPGTEDGFEEIRNGVEGDRRAAARARG
jgi:hypothetical protein